jgi:flagellar basal-body rod modification protein FlgD
MAIDLSSVLANSATTASTSSTTKTSSASALGAGTSAADISDRFMKLLVAQMKNQDPLNPADNNQITSQMAQINTVSGISTLNTSMQALSTQVVGMQALQGASLVGNNVVVPGNKLSVDKTGAGVGGFTLDSPADTVKVDILNAAGSVVGSQTLTGESAGKHSFNFDASGISDTSNLTFKVTATNGAAKVGSTALMLDTVSAVSTSGGALQLELAKSGTTPYSNVVALN